MENVKNVETSDVKGEPVATITPPVEENKKVAMRQIIIESDGNSVNLVRADVAGRIELIGILESLIGFLKK